MAVVQISRIQIRRGQKNITGMPQLASGELAWAVDTQELYIGNGSVFEGSPGVGNTKILTQNDLTVEGNLLNLLQHIYKVNDTVQTGAEANVPVSRSLQDRLDDRVTLTDFITQDDIDADDYTTAIQRAIDQLFYRSGAQAYDFESSRITLELPAGVYTISDTLVIPSYATIVGAGADKTIINFIVNTWTDTISWKSGALVEYAGDYYRSIDTVPAGTAITNTLYWNSAPATAIEFRIDADLDPVNISYTAQPKFITLKNLSLHTATSDQMAFDMYCVRNSIFENINITGDWLVGDTENDTSIGINMTAFSSVVSCEDNIFNNVHVSNFNYGVFAKTDILNNVFQNGSINTAKQGFCLGKDATGGSTGEEYGPRRTIISKYKFDNVKQHGVYIEVGIENVIENSSFYNVGREGGNVALTQYPQVFFGSHGNSVENNKFDRYVADPNPPGGTTDLATHNLTTPYIPEVSGWATYTSFGTRRVSLGSSGGLAFRLPVVTNSAGIPKGGVVYTVDYVFQSTGTIKYARRGTLNISAWVQQNTNDAYVQLTDEYDYAGPTDLSVEDALNLDFSATLLNEAGSTYTGTGQDPYSIAVNFSNVTTGDSGYMTYSFKAIHSQYPA